MLRMLMHRLMSKQQTLNERYDQDQVLREDMRRRLSFLEKQIEVLRGRQYDDPSSS